MPPTPSRASSVWLGRPSADGQRATSQCRTALASRTARASSTGANPCRSHAIALRPASTRCFSKVTCTAFDNTRYVVSPEPVQMTLQYIGDETRQSTRQPVLLPATSSPATFASHRHGRSDRSGSDHRATRSQASAPDRSGTTCLEAMSHDDCANTSRRAADCWWCLRTRASAEGSSLRSMRSHRVS